MNNYSNGLLSGTSRLLRRLANALAVASAGGVALMALAVAADAMSRNAGAGSLPLVFDAGGLAVIFTAYLPLAFVQLAQEHVQFGLVTDKLPRRPRAGIIALGYAAIIVMLGWMLYETSRIALDSYQSGETRLGEGIVPVWPGHAAIVIGLAPLILVFLSQVFSLLVELRTEGETEGVGE